MRKTFVASSDLRPMAQQLLQWRSPAAYSGVEQYTRRHANDDVAALAWLVLGYAHFLDHDFEKATLALKHAQAHAGELSDYVTYFLASAYASQNQHQAAAGLLQGFAEKYPESLFGREAALLYANTLLSAGKPGDAVAALAPYRTPYRPEIELAAGRALLRSGDVKRGVETLRRIYFSAPASPQADAANAELQPYEARPEMAPPSLAERQKRAELLLAARRYQDSAREYRALLAGSEPANLAELQLNLGIALYRSGSRGEAREALEALGERQDELGARRDQFLLEIARSDGDEDKVHRLLDRMRQNAPHSAALEDALLSAGNLYLLKKDYEQAARYYTELAQRFPSGRYGSYAHWKAAWIAWRLDHKDEARQLIDEQLRLFPAGQEIPAALYWRGRLAEDDHDAARARSLYEKLAQRFRNYYYTDLARGRLRELLGASARSGEGGAASAGDPVLRLISGPQPPAIADIEPPADNVRLQKSLLLRNAAMFDYAVKELEAASAEGENDWVVREIARTWQEAGQYHRALQALKRAVPSYFASDLAALPRPVWEGLFPRPWWSDVKRFAADNHLDPFLVASLIRQESEFNPAAISRANAFGLMQLLPSVGRDLAHELKLRPYSNDLLLTPDVNLRLGSRYFKTLLDKFGGQLEYALAAYNAGSDRVDDWLAAGRFRDVPEFVESIPFTETREYVQAILRNTTVYRELYGNP